MCDSTVTGGMQNAAAAKRRGRASGTRLTRAYLIEAGAVDNIPEANLHSNRRLDFARGG
jgi:hypothetical protein